MWKFLKTMAAEDVITTEEVLAEEVLEEEVLVAEVLEEEVQHQEKVVVADLEALLQEKADLEATEIQHQEKVAFLEVQHKEPKVDLVHDLQKDLQMHQNAKAGLQVEHQDVRKVQVIRQDLEDQEKINNFC